MSNTLTKITRATYSPGAPGVPGNPGVPYRAAYTAWETQTVCGWQWPYGTTWEQADNGQWYEQPIIPEGQISVAQVYACVQKNVPTYYPEQEYVPPTAPTPATESRLIYDYNLGWNSGARSEQSINGDSDGSATFVIPAATTGAFAGFNDADVDAGYVNLEHAVYCSRGVARIYERGVERHYVGLYPAGAVFKIQRRGGVVTYWMNDTLQYTSTAPSVGTVFLDASLYTGGDTITSPTIAEEIHVVLSFEPMDAKGADQAYAASAVSFLPMAVTSNPLTKAALTFEPLQMLAAAQSSYAQATLSFESLIVTAEFNVGPVKPSYNIGEAVMVPAVAYGFAPIARWGTGVVSMEPMQSLGVARAAGSEAPRLYAAASLSLQPMQTLAYAYEQPGEASFISLAQTRSTVTAGYDVFVVMNSAAQVEGVFALQALVDANLASQGAALSAFEVNALISAVIESIATGRTVAPIEEQAREVWVVNADTMGSTRYENYAFNSFAQIGSDYYGCRADGIYKLDGDTDNGVPIQAMMSFGKQTFGTTALKAVTNAYIGTASGGKLYLKVLYEGHEYLYAARDGSEHIQVQRVDIGKGIRANYIEFELYNADGDDFELASVEFAAVALSRRI